MKRSFVGYFLLLFFLWMFPNCLSGMLSKSINIKGLPSTRFVSSSERITMALISKLSHGGIKEDSCMNTMRDAGHRNSDEIIKDRNFKVKRFLQIGISENTDTKIIKVVGDEHKICSQLKRFNVCYLDLFDALYFHNKSIYYYLKNRFFHLEFCQVNNIKKSRSVGGHPFRESFKAGFRYVANAIKNDIEWSVMNTT